MAITIPHNPSKMQKFGVFRKIQDIGYINMGIEILKIEEEMTKKLKPQVA